MFDEFKHEKFDIILQGGQSNANGNGIGPVEEEYIPDDDIIYMTRFMEMHRAEERFRDHDQNYAGDFSLTFAKNYKEKGLLASGRKILIVRTAVGGTGFNEHHWGIGDPMYEHMMEMVQIALDMNHENRLVAFLWHQGESDEGTSAALTKERIITLVRSVQEKYNCPSLPFICGDFVHEWREHKESVLSVISGLISACIDLGNSRFVLTDNLTSNNQILGNGDILHFRRDALHKLGDRYFAAYYDLIGGSQC